MKLLHHEGMGVAICISQDCQWRRNFPISKPVFSLGHIYGYVRVMVSCTEYDYKTQKLFIPFVTLSIYYYSETTE